MMALWEGPSGMPNDTLKKLSWCIKKIVRVCSNEIPIGGWGEERDQNTIWSQVINQSPTKSPVKHQGQIARIYVYQKRREQETRQANSELFSASGLETDTVLMQLDDSLPHWQPLGKLHILSEPCTSSQLDLISLELRVSLHQISSLSSPTLVGSGSASASRGGLKVLFWLRPL